MEKLRDTFHVGLWGLEEGEEEEEEEVEEEQEVEEVEEEQELRRGRSRGRPTDHC